MHFKRLEIIGFKSFRDRTIFEFERGVTAIVGPNGCGKSNISDAIRWVLGEQSAKDLRGGRMEDVIFNGTQRDEPLGLAEVSLTLSNEKKFLPIDYDEVTITRRLFRSGESEYLINHVPVRLRDVVELVMGTGLGQTSYAHMAQGRIDEVLSAHPEERRLLFEEASGITKYRSQKKEALRKLEQTEANLIRVSDILLELGRQIRTLERQAERARRYKEDFEKLKTLESGVARQKRDHLLQESGAVSGKKETLGEKEENAQREREALSEGITSLQDKLGALENTLGTLQGKKMDLASEIRKNEDRILLHQERIGELTQDGERLHREREQLTRDLEELKHHVQASKDEFESSLEAIEVKKTTLLSLEALLKEILHTLSMSEQEISQGKLKILELAQEQSKVRNDLSSLSAEHHTLSSREHRLALEKEEISAEETRVEVRRETMEAAVQKTKEVFEGLKEEKKKLEEEVHTFSQRLQDLVGEIQGMRQKRVALASRCEFLEEARRNYEGFSQGAKAILKEIEQKTPSFANYHGVLADLLEVLPGYERAFEELLGSWVQAVVVEDEEAAREGIHYLEEKGLGRAAFIALSCFKEFHRGGGNALSKVNIPPHYQNLLSHLLGEASIVENLEAIPIPQDPHGIYATLKGEVYRRGVLTGGSLLSGDLGLIGRERRIAALREEIAQTEKILKELSDKERNLTGAQKEREALLSQETEECRRWEVELTNQENLLKSALGEEQKIREELSVVTLELSEVEEELKELHDKENTLSEKVRRLEGEDQKLQEFLAAHQEILRQKQAEREEAIVQIAEIKTEVAAAVSHHEARQKAHTLLETAFQEKWAFIASKEEEERSGRDRVQKLSEEIATLKTENLRLLGEEELIVRDSSTMVEGKARLLGEKLSFQNQIGLLDEILQKIQAELHALEMKEKELEYEMKALEERFRLTYKMELLSLSGEGEPVDVDEVRPEIEKLREKLERMGPVNLVAIEEYEELKKRNVFLTAQKGDLEKAKASLLEAIQKINRVTKELFLATFRQVQTHFQDYFRVLFGGGRAELILLNEEDVLESGIEILACPPGKKLQNVSLLSGGERALTVIALLFAIFKEKPSPFCVLDEIDAPLDESNIVRFTGVLQEFLKSSQFILVTHNKRTITMADVMYGITMERTGVSKIVSVKFKDEESEKEEAIPA